jgi:hypothetical protein
MGSLKFSWGHSIFILLDSNSKNYDNDCYHNDDIGIFAEIESEFYVYMSKL